MARTDPEAGKRGISAFVVPSDAPGLRVGAVEEKVGLRASRTSALVLDGCRVGAENLLGREGEGLKIALSTLDHSRLGIAAQALGMHRRGLELATGYARERVQFGVPIARHQAVQFQIAEIATSLAAARTLTHHAALVSAEGAPEAGRLASEAKVLATEAANRGVWLAQQIHGGNGFSEEYEIGRLYRDVRVTTIYEGTSEMQRLVIARKLLRT
jgi:alkylation response protein AidB-like acyl-CoA dehydrogenase